MRKAFAALVIGGVLGITAQAGAGAPMEKPEVDPSITNGSAARAFNQARAKWRAAGVANYRMKVSRSCYCATPSQATVTVRNGKVTKVSVRGWTGPRTVPAMFRVVGRAIKQKVAVLDVKYDPALGYAKKAYIDYIAMAIDDEIGYRITRFQQL